MSYPALNFPRASLRLSKIDSQLFVWCIIRKKQLLLTPEEWVRQHTIHYLINTLLIPIGRIASEHTLNINGQKRRCDLAVFDSFGKEMLIVECKSSVVRIDEKVFLQTSNYVSKTNARFFWMTNGLEHVFSDCKYPEIIHFGLPQFIVSN